MQGNLGLIKKNLIHRFLSLDELNLNTNLELLELGPFVYEHVKSLISIMDYENNHVDKESESCKNRGKKGYKE